MKYSNTSIDIKVFGVKDIQDGQSLIIYINNSKIQIIIEYYKPMSSFDDYVHKLNTIPPLTNKLLRHLREIDRKTQQKRIILQQTRESFLKQLQNWKAKKAAKFQKELQEEYRKIIKLQKQMDEYSRQKIGLAEKLYSMIHDPTQKLDKQLQIRGLDHSNDDQSYSKKKRGKKNLKKYSKNIPCEVNPNQPRYCYCNGNSYGQMVNCESGLDCKGGQWFHINCIEQKKLPQIWYCKVCRQLEHTGNSKKRFK